MNYKLTKKRRKEIEKALANHDWDFIDSLEAWEKLLYANVEIKSKEDK